MANREFTAALLLAIAAAFMQPVHAQSKVDIQGALKANFQVAMSNPQTNQLVSGTVLVLQKGKIVMDSTEAAWALGNVYQNGDIQPEGWSTNPARWDAIIHPGEKVVVASYSTRSDSVQLILFSTDLQFQASIRFPFPQKGVFPAANDVLKQISEVFKRGTLQEASRQQQPPAQPATIAVGMSRDQVIGAYGTPSKVARVGTKEIDVFPGAKVTFINGKVADVK